MNLPIFIIFICFSSTTFSLKIYKSSLAMLNTKQISGLAYKRNINQNVVYYWTTTHYTWNEYSAILRNSPQY